MIPEFSSSAKHLEEDNNTVIGENVNNINPININTNTNTNIIKSSSVSTSFNNGQASSSSSSPSSSSSSSPKEASHENFEEGETFIETSSRGSNTSAYMSSSLYSAELVTSSCDESAESVSSNENEISSPIKPLKAMTNTNSNFRYSNNNNNNNSQRISNVYEILQEIKPDHPLRIHTQFEFAPNNNPRASLTTFTNSVCHNPLLHHHRNSFIYNNNNNSRNSYYSTRRYSTPRTPSYRYSNFQRSSEYSEHSENNSSSNNNNNSVRNSSYSVSINQEKHLYCENNNNESNFYGKYFFLFGFLFMPIWWLGSFYKPLSTKDYKWRKWCRNASVWSFIVLVLVVIVIIIYREFEQVYK